MKHRAVLLTLLFLALATTASADSIPTVTVDADAFEVSWSKLEGTFEEPFGLLARASIPELGLKAGDVVFGVNGIRPVGALHYGTRTVPVVFLEVQRGSQNLVIKLMVKPADHKAIVERPEYVTKLAEMRDGGLNQLTKNKAPTGVVLGTLTLWELGQPGDVIRSIDGTPVKTVQQVADAFEKAKDHPQVVVKLERAGMPFTTTLTFVDQVAEVDIAMVSQIKKTSDTTYDLPRLLVDAVLSNPMSVAKGARIVPAVLDGKPHGFKLYAIRPSSIYAALGLVNGDTVVAVNGLNLTSAENALDAYTKLRDAKKITVSIERRGKPLDLIWTITGK